MDFAQYDILSQFATVCRSNQTATRSQHIWQQRNVAPQLINLWLTANTACLTVSQPTNTCMTTTAETVQCNNWLECLSTWSCHDLIILSLSARLYAFQGGSCCVKPIAVLHLTVDGYSLHVYWHVQIHRWSDRRDPFEFRFQTYHAISWDPYSCFVVKPRDPICSCFVTIHWRYRQTDNRQHHITKAELGDAIATFS